jgi:hypothetical protein
MTGDNSRSRRRVLQLAGAGTVGTLMGCLGLLSGAEPTVIKDITFQDETVVVHLTDESNADAIDFRSPTDELLETASIGRKSQVEFDLHPATNRPRPPGEYTLVAVTTSGNGDSQRISTRPLTLTSAFAVSEIHPVSKPATGNPLPFEGKLQLTIENTGTLPLRLTYIGVPNGVPSPNPAPSETSVRKQGYTLIAGTQDPIPIGKTATFESEVAPLWTQGGRAMDGTIEQGAVGIPKQSASWAQVKRTHCNGEQHPATLLVIPWQGPTHRLTVTFKYAGHAARQRQRDTDYGCTNVSVVSIERANTTATKRTSASEGNG